MTKIIPVMEHTFETLIEQDKTVQIIFSDDRIDTDVINDVIREVWDDWETTHPDIHSFPDESDKKVLRDYVVLPRQEYENLVEDYVQLRDAEDY